MGINGIQDSQGHHAGVPSAIHRIGISQEFGIVKRGVSKMSKYTVHVTANYEQTVEAPDEKTAMEIVDAEAQLSGHSKLIESVDQYIGLSSEQIEEWLNRMTSREVKA